MTKSDHITCMCACNVTVSDCLRGNVLCSNGQSNLDSMLILSVGGIYNSAFVLVENLLSQRRRHVVHLGLCMYTAILLSN